VVAILFAATASLVTRPLPPAAPRARLPASITNDPSTYDGKRAINILSELVSRSVGRMPKAGADASRLKSEILELLAPFGDPALSVPSTTFQQVNAACRELERENPNANSAALDALQGTWKVRYSDAPPPSNGALGPFRGRAYQVVDVSSRTYTNELSVFSGALDVKLSASFEPKEPPAGLSSVALRVAFETIQFSLFGLGLPAVKFPQGTERTWLLTYTDDDTRLVRAGVDGGRSTARDVGLLQKEEGEAADSYLFVLTRATEADLAQRPISNPITDAARRRQLKAELMEAIDGQRQGAAADKESVAAVEAIMNELAALNPTADPAGSPLLCGTWDIAWTTESELLGVMDNGFFGLRCTASYQTISRQKAAGTAPGSGSGSGWEYTLQNSIDFEGESDSSSGFLRVGSTCEPASAGARVNFRFESCALKWRQLQLPLPPVGSGWFDVIYMDDSLRLCKDVRGDLQICTRR